MAFGKRHSGKPGSAAAPTRAAASKPASREQPLVARQDNIYEQSQDDSGIKLSLNTKRLSLAQQATLREEVKENEDFLFFSA